MAFVLTAGAACTKQGADPESSSDASVQEVPLTLQVDPPEEIPDLFLVAGDGKAIGGMIFLSHWGDRTAREKVPSQIRWPVRVLVWKPDTLTVNLGTDVIPETVTVRAYAPASDGRGKPVGEPIVELDCWLEQLSATGPCQLAVGPGGALILPLPPLPAPAALDIVVYVAWTDTQANDPAALGTSWASWLFSVESKGTP